MKLSKFTGSSPFRNGLEKIQGIARLFLLVPQLEIPTAKSAKCYLYSLQVGPIASNSTKKLNLQVYIHSIERLWSRNKRKIIFVCSQPFFVRSRPYFALRD